MRRDLRTRLTVSTLALALAAAACGAAPEGSAPLPVTVGGTAAIGWCEPDTLLPASAFSNCAGSLLDSIFDPLLFSDLGTGELRPEAATSVTSDDAVVWTIDLRPGMTFHDGLGIDASTYVTSWNWVKDPANAQAATSQFERIIGIEATSDLQLTVTLSAPFALFREELTGLAFLPLHPLAMSDPEAYEDAPIGNGPYRVDGTWRRDDGIDLVRYDGYTGATPGALDRIELTSFADGQTAELEFQAGGIDVLTNVPSDRADAYLDDLEALTLAGPSGFATYLWLPTYVDWLSDPDVRRALSLSVDRVGIAGQIIRAGALPADDVVPFTVSEYLVGACDFCRHDADEAAALVGSATLPDPMPIWISEGGTNGEVALAIGNGIRASLGVEFEIKSLQFPDFVDKIQNKAFTGPFVIGWNGGSSSRGTLGPLMTTTGEQPVLGYSNPTFDDLIARAEAEPVIERRTALLHEAADIVLNTDTIIAPLYFSAQVMAWRAGTHLNVATPLSFRHRLVSVS